MKIKTLPIACVALFLASCGGEAPADKTPKDSAQDKEMMAEEPTEERTVSEIADFKFHTMLANLPSPLETFQLLANVNIEALDTRLTPVSKAEELSTSTAKAYGYGMYMADMGFMAYEHQNQQVLDYYQVCRQLATELGAGEVFDRTISQDFEENTSNEAQFVKMMDGAFNAMDEYMMNNERFVNATEIFVGSWVESQIIATQILQDRPLNENNRPIYEGIYAQKQHASNLMNVLGEVDTEVEEQILASVEDLMMFYAGFSSVENISTEDMAELETKLMNLKELLLT